MRNDEKYVITNEGKLRAAKLFMVKRVKEVVENLTFGHILIYDLSNRPAK
jgi:hypothetical protein